MPSPTSSAVFFNIVEKGVGVKGILAEWHEICIKYRKSRKRLHNNEQIVDMVHCRWWARYTNFLVSFHPFMFLSLIFFNDRISQF